MRFKTLVALLLFVAAIGIVVMATPASAAKPGDSVTYQGPGGYTVTLTKVQPSLLSMSGMSTMSMSSSISQGEYQWYGKYITSCGQSYGVRLSWGNTYNSLRLRIFTADGYILGPYYDTSDGGNANGVIGITITRSGGVALGEWENEIYGYSVSGSQSYYIE
ncbi:MAG: hypothetical protein WBZ29_15015 [Methanocella sp.]